MPRCTCPGSSCNCTIVSGPGILVSGSGIERDPLMISLSALSALVVHDDDGELDLSEYPTMTAIRLELNADVTDIFTQTDSGYSLDLFIVSGGGDITWPAYFVFAGGTPPALSTTPGNTDWLRIKVMAMSTGVLRFVDVVGLDYPTA